MIMSESEVIEQTLRISARPETIWRYWTDPQRTREWWGPAAELDPTPGGICRVEMGGGSPRRRAPRMGPLPAAAR